MQQDQIHKQVKYRVPNGKRIEVEAGDIIGWAGTSLLYGYGDDHSYWNDYGDDDTCIYWNDEVFSTDKDEYELWKPMYLREYAINATVKPFEGMYSTCKNYQKICSRKILSFCILTIKLTPLNVQLCDV